MTTNPTATAPAAAPEKKFALTSSRHFADWLARTGASLAFTTYQAGKVFLLGLKPDGRLAVFERTFARCMGLGVAPTRARFVLATHYQLLRFDNVVARAAPMASTTRCSSPHVAWITGDLDAHDWRSRADGRPVFVNTLFSCLATVERRHSFMPLWRPPFITQLAPEDRCHLNGLAMDDGQPRYVTAVADPTSPTAGATNARDGGMVIDVATGEIVAARPVDAAFAAPARRPALAAQLRHRRVRLRRSRREANSSRSRSARAMRAGSLSSATMPWSACRCRARTAPSRACRSTRRWPRAAPSRAAGCW